jgi:hypothetical protein
LLSQIQTNRASLVHGRLRLGDDLNAPPWHIDAVAGRPPHHHCQCYSRGAAGPGLSAVQEKLAKAQNRAVDVFASLYLPQLPTQHEMVRRARAMFADTPSMDVIVSRAHAVILDTIGVRLSAIAAAH